MNEETKANVKLRKHMKDHSLDLEGLRDSFRWDAYQKAYGAKMPNELYGHPHFDKAIAQQADTYNVVLKEMDIRGAAVVRGPPDNFYIVIPIESKNAKFNHIPYCGNRISGRL